MTTKVTTAEARKNLADIVNSVAYGKDTVALTRRDKELAALVSMMIFCYCNSLKNNKILAML